MPNLDDLDPTSTATDGIPADSTDSTPAAEPAPDQPLEGAQAATQATGADAESIDENDLPLGDVATIVGEAVARQALFAVGDAMLEGKFDPLTDLVTRFVGVISTVMEGPAITAVRAIRAREDQEAEERMFAHRRQVISVLGEAKKQGLPDKAIMFLLRSMVDDYSKEEPPSLGDRILQQALPVLAKAGFDAGYQSTGGCGDCGRRHGWNVAPAPGSAPAGDAEPLIQQDVATHIPHAYGVPGVSPQAVQFAQFAGGFGGGGFGGGRSMTHADVAAAYGTSSIPPNGFMPPGAIPVPFQTMIGNRHGLGHQPTTVVVEGVNRTVEAVTPSGELR